MVSEAMEIIPAVDLRNGKCVRLYQGDYTKETVFSDDPASMALRWQSEGAKRLHLVDLDGAAKGEPCNLIAIQKIAESVEIPIELGGGIRSLDTIEQLLKLGVGRVILGTVAIENPDMVQDACRRFREQVIIGIDARDGWVATRGWLEKSSVTAGELAKQMIGLGARRFIYTDISRFRGDRRADLPSERARNCRRGNMLNRPSDEARHDRSRGGNNWPSDLHRGC